MNPPPSAPGIVNIAAYRFAPLSELRGLRAELLTHCREWGLKGTILISGEGINLFVAGVPDSVEQLLTCLRAMPGLEGLQAKYSETTHQPFTRMLVRIKKEIIAFGVPGIDPFRYTSKRIAPAQLRQWLDEGRPVTLLDTRNDYEVKLGTFRNAVAIGVDHFREFPQGVAKLSPALRDQPIVTFCTGGIRCEKAAPFLETQGFSNVYQLDGGILKYFEECGSAHYDGDCFVFDQRVGLDPQLQETSATQCFRCLSPLSEVEQGDPRTVPGKSCPYCFVTPEQQRAAALVARQSQWQSLVRPLPGSVSRDNFRPLSVSQHCDGRTLLDALCFSVKHLPAAYWEQECRAGKVLDADRVARHAGHIVRAGERYLHRVERDLEPAVNPDVQFLYEDEGLVVLNKPAPLPMHPGGRFNRNTLQHLLELVYHPQKPRPAHRLDANTSGVLVVARTRHFASRLQPLFAAGQVQKRYLVRVNGNPAAERFACDAPIGSQAEEMGTRSVDLVSGQPARTEFRVLERCADGTVLLEALPLTGRTNQIRIHCAYLGFPVCGDQAYRGEGAAAVAQTNATDDPPLCLHSWEIAFRHPVSGESVCWSAAAPAWAASLAGTCAP